MADKRRLEVEITGNASSLKSATSQANRSLGGFSNNAKKLGGVLAGAFAVGAITNFTKEAFKAAAVAEGVTKAFNKTGASLKELQKATKGTVDEFKLMQSAVQAKNLGVEVSQLATLFEFAQKRAEETGESVEYLTQSIVTGIGRKSVLILDNLGLSSVRINEEFRKMGNFSAAVGKIVREELESMGDGSDSAATNVQKVSASFENLKGRMGEFLTGPGSGFLTWLDEAIQETDRFFRLAQYGGLNLKQWQKDLLLGAESTKDLAGTIELYEHQLEQAREEAARLRKEAFSSEATAEQRANYNNHVENAIKIDNWLKILRNRFNELKSAEDAAADAAARAAAKAKAEIAGLYEATATGNVGSTESPLDALLPKPNMVASRMAALDAMLVEFYRKSAERAKEAANLEADIAEEGNEQKMGILSAGLQFAAGIISSISTMQMAAMNAEIKAADGNEKEIEKIRKKYAEKSKKLAIMQALINGAMAITNIIATAPGSVLNPAAWAAIGVAGAMTGVQVGMIASQQYAKGTSFAPGGMALVGERGPEIVSLPRGASVTPNHLIGGSGSANIVLQVGEYEFARIVNVALNNQNSRVSRTTFV